jgi:hypothetical protein
MARNSRNQAVIDKFEIIEVATVSRWCRDTGNWARLVEGFHPEANVETSWFSGTPEQFAEQSKHMMAGLKPTEGPRHIMGNPCVILKGDRAVCEYYIILYNRRSIDGYEFDFQTWSTCLDLFEKRAKSWRISKRFTIYTKDRMDPYKAGEVPDSYFARMDLSSYPAAIRYHCYRNERNRGKLPSQSLILNGTPEEEAARKEAAEWLADR